MLSWFFLTTDHTHGTGAAGPQPNGDAPFGETGVFLSGMWGIREMKEMKTVGQLSRHLPHLHDLLIPLETIFPFGHRRHNWHEEDFRVIASEAKQSQSAIAGASANPDCFASLAMTHR
jgi:hypothetical protein